MGLDSPELGRRVPGKGVAGSRGQEDSAGVPQPPTELRDQPNFLVPAEEDFENIGVGFGSEPEELPQVENRSFQFAFRDRVALAGLQISHECRDGFGIGRLIELTHAAVEPCGGGDRHSLDVHIGVCSVGSKCPRSRDNEHVRVISKRKVDGSQRGHASRLWEGSPGHGGVEGVLGWGVHTAPPEPS